MTSVPDATHDAVTGADGRFGDPAPPNPVPHAADGEPNEIVNRSISLSGLEVGMVWDGTKGSSHRPIILKYN